MKLQPARMIVLWSLLLSATILLSACGPGRIG
jgi:hypothetical protein